MSRPDESARIEAHAERFPESVPGVDEILAGLRDARFPNTVGTGSNGEIGPMVVLSETVGIEPTLCSLHVGGRA